MLDELRVSTETRSVTNTYAERRAFIRSFAKEVKVTGDSALLTYTIPLSPKGIPEEKVGVLSTVQYGGR